MKQITVEDQTLTVGDSVGFKYDVEQSGPIVRIEGRNVVVLAFEGSYVDDHEDGMEVTLRVSDLYLD